MAKRRRERAFPISNQGRNFTQMPNELFELQRDLLPNTFRILCSIVRRTNGWHVLFAPLTHADIMAATGIRSRTTIRQCLAELLQKGFIVQLEAGSGRDHRTYYGLTSEETYWAYEGVRSGALDIPNAQTAHGDVDNRHVINMGAESDRSSVAPAPAPETGRAPPSGTRSGVGQRTAQNRETPDREIRNPGPSYPRDSETANATRDSCVTPKGFREKASEQVARLIGWVEDRLRPERREP